MLTSRLIISKSTATIILAPVILNIFFTSATALLAGIACGDTETLRSTKDVVEDHANVEPQSPIKDWSLHAQMTAITQRHFSINSPYQGKNSLSPDGEYKTSYTATIFSGLRLWRGGEIFVDHESQAGMGMSKTLGIAGYPNGEIYRIDKPAPKASLVRYYYRQIIGLAGAQEYREDAQNQLSGYVDINRLSVVFGKFSLNDFFDLNTYSHDPRTQFFNWGLMDTGAWDYSADTRGYTHGVMIDWNRQNYAIRYAAVMVPKQANQMFLEWHKFPATARGDNLELELRYQINSHPGTTKVLAYMNHAHMGNYREATHAPTGDGTIDIADTRTYSVKKGFVLNLEQEVAQDTGAFVRLGWNDGATETWAFTEIDRSLALGFSGKSRFLGRTSDSYGIAVLINGLSPDHRDYLAAGGYGFIIGDGHLNFATEKIVEIFYNIGIGGDYLQLTPDFQYIQNPAYNRDRGPVPVYGMRLHAQI